eukprot:SAG31_NODE_450_length_15512_cov_5.788555_16_plen_123_part_00
MDLVISSFAQRRANFVIEPYSRQRLSDLASVDLIGDTGALVLIFRGEDGDADGSATPQSTRWPLLAATASVRLLPGASTDTLSVLNVAHVLDWQIRQGLLTEMQSAWRAMLMADLPVRRLPS